MEYLTAAFDFVVDSAKWVGEVAMDVFESPVAMDALKGAAMGGIVAAVSGEDIVDGALIGGAIGGTLSMANQMMTSSPTSASSSSTDTVDPVSGDANGVNFDTETMRSNRGMTGGLIDPVAGANPSASPHTVNIGTDIALNGVNASNVASLSEKLVPTSATNIFKKGADLWSKTSADTKTEIIGAALSGGAAAYGANKQAKVLEKMKERELQAYQDRQDSQYQNTKAKVGSVSGAMPSFTLNDSYSRSRLNPDPNF